MSAKEVKAHLGTADKVCMSAEEADGIELLSLPQHSSSHHHGHMTPGTSKKVNGLWQCVWGKSVE